MEKIDEIFEKLSPEEKQVFKNYLKIATPLAILNVAWWIVSLVYSAYLLNTYKLNLNFRSALLTVDGIALASVFALIPMAYTIWKEENRRGENFKFLLKRILNLAVFEVILIVCNLATYLVSGVLDNILIFYQLWQAPASLLLWHNLLRIN